jgi:hypothetical protein
MSNFELIDDYLTNRLGEQERVTFEQRVGSDPALQADVELQKHILEGVKKARAAELKAMLNNVPVGGGFSSGLTAGKIAAGVVVAGLVATCIYLYVKPSETPAGGPSVISKNQTAPPASTEKATTLTPATPLQPATDQSLIVDPRKAKANPPKKKKSSKPVETPQSKIEVVDPSDELVDNSAKEADAGNGQKSSITTSHIAVETNTSSKKYNFHYQFNRGQLVLYGPFDKSLYEILEIHGDQHAVFLFYKENYYLLDEKQKKIAELQSIRDSTVLKKLKEYRGR